MKKLKQFWSDIKFWFWKLLYRIRYRGDPPARITGWPSRSYLRKLYKPVLQEIDRRVNDEDGNRFFLLMERRLLVVRRRHGIIPEEA
jgi:hypothetical protein